MISPLMITSLDQGKIYQAEKAPLSETDATAAEERAEASVPLPRRLAERAQGLLGAWTFGWAGQR